MTKEELEIKIRMWKQVVIVIFNLIVKPSLYMIFMWAFQVAAAFLFFRDLWTAAGFISAISLYQITQAEFKKEYFGART